MVVIRHGSSGRRAFLAERIPSNVINAGDGWHEHPTQGLLDLLTIRDHSGRIDGLKVCIVRRHPAQPGRAINISGSASSVPRWPCVGRDAHAARHRAAGRDRLHAHRGRDRMGRRAQRAPAAARAHGGGFIPSLREYNRVFGVTHGRLDAAPGHADLHPGPMNRGVEIDSDVADGPHSVILPQVTNGVAVRMAVLYLLAGGSQDWATAEVGRLRVTTILLQGGRLIDPSPGSRRACRRAASGWPGRRRSASTSTSPDGADVVDTTGKVVAPGLIDLHVHLREPGQEDQETVATGAAAAAAGGLHRRLCHAQHGPGDRQSGGGRVHHSSIDACQTGPCVSHRGRVPGPAGYTVGRIREMVAAGAVAVSDDGHPVATAHLMRTALEYAKTFGIPVADHCEEMSLAQGSMHEGIVSTRLGVPGIPSAAEEIMVARDIILAELTGGRVHLCHMSTRGSVDLIRRAKEKGLLGHRRSHAPITSALTHERCEGYDTNAKMNPSAARGRRPAGHPGSPPGRDHRRHRERPRPTPLRRQGTGLRRCPQRDHRTRNCLRHRHDRVGRGRLPDPLRVDRSHEHQGRPGSSTCRGGRSPKVRRPMSSSSTPKRGGSSIRPPHSPRAATHRSVARPSWGGRS